MKMVGKSTNKRVTHRKWRKIYEKVIEKEEMVLDNLLGIMISVRRWKKKLKM